MEAEAGLMQVRAKDKGAKKLLSEALGEAQELPLQQRLRL